MVGKFHANMFNFAVQRIKLKVEKASDGKGNKTKERKETKYSSLSLRANKNFNISELVY